MHVSNTDYHYSLEYEYTISVQNVIKSSSSLYRLNKLTREIQANIFITAIIIIRIYYYYFYYSLIIIISVLYLSISLAVIP